MNRCYCIFVILFLLTGCAAGPTAAPANQPPQAVLLANTTSAAEVGETQTPVPAQQNPATDPTQAAAAPAVASATPSPSPLPLPPSGDWQISAHSAAALDLLYQARLSQVGQIWDLKWSPDGRLLAVSGRGGVILLDGESFELIEELDLHAPAASMAFSADSRFLAFSGASLTIQVWDTRDQRLLQVIPNAGQQVALSADGRLVAAVEDTPEPYSQGAEEMMRTVIKVFRVDTGQLVSTLTAVGATSIWNPLFVDTIGLYFSADNSSLQAANILGDVRRWDVSSGRLLGTSLNDHTRSRLSIGHCETAGASGSSFALACYISYLDPPCIESTPGCNPIGKSRYDVGLWDANQLKRANNLTIKDPPGDVLSLFYHAGQRNAGLFELATQSVYWAALNGKTTFQALNQSQPALWAQLQGDCKNCIPRTAIHPDGTKLAVGQFGRILLVDLASGDASHVYENEIRSLTSAALGEKAGWPVIATGSSDGAISIVQLASSAVLRTVEQAHTKSISQLALAGEDVLSVGAEGALYLWRDGQPQPVQSLETVAVRGPFSYGYRFAFSPAANLLAVDFGGRGANTPYLMLRDVGTGQDRLALDMSGTALAFSQDGRWLAVGGSDAALIDTGSGALLRAFLLPDPAELARGIAVSPDGSLLAVSEAQQAMLWNVNTSQVTARLEFNDYQASSLDFSPSGCLLAVGNSGGQITLLDVQTGRVLAEWWGHAGRVERLSFSADGRLLLSTGIDGKANVWGQPGALSLPAGAQPEQSCRISAPPVTSTPVTPTVTATPVTPTATPTQVSFYRPLSLSDPVLVGADVLQLQRRLSELGYSDVGVPDGSFGPKTGQAVRLFQERNGLVVDGIVGAITWTRLFSDAAVRR